MSGAFSRSCPQHRLNFLPLPQGQRSFLPVFTLVSNQINRLTDLRRASYAPRVAALHKGNLMNAMRSDASSLFGYDAVADAIIVK
jgi:hypothetical protein